VIVSGDIGRHGVGVLALREGLEFEAPIESDCAPLWSPVEALLTAAVPVHCLRDLTRGGLCAALCEIAEAAGLGMVVDETAVPLREDVRGVCELLGLDPLHVACEGRMVAFVPEAEADRALAVLRADPLCVGAVAVGRVESGPAGRVVLRTAIGTRRVLDRPTQAQLPRIC
jgi:hydrogenase expression/formation protein HypE